MSATLSLIIDVDLLLANVPLDDLLVLHDLLAQADLLLYHRSLLHHNLFLQKWHHELVFADLGFGRLPRLHEHPLDAHLLTPLGHPDPLALGANPLANPHRSGLALAGPGPKLFFGPLPPKLALAPAVSPSRTEALSSVTVALAVPGAPPLVGRARYGGRARGVVLVALVVI